MKNERHYIWNFKLYNYSEPCFLSLFWTIKYKRFIFLSLIFVLIPIMRYLLLFYLLLLRVYIHSRRSWSHRHWLWNHRTETHTLICLHYRIILLVFLVTLVHLWKLILTQQSLQFALVWTVRLLWGTPFIGVEFCRILYVFGHFIILYLEVLLSIIGVLIDVLNGAFLLEIGMNDTIVLIELLFLLFFLEFFDSFD